MTTKVSIRERRRAAGHLLVFKRNSVWILYGTSPANFTLRQLCFDLMIGQCFQIVVVRLVVLANRLGGYFCGFRRGRLLSSLSANTPIFRFAFRLAAGALGEPEDDLVETTAERKATRANL